MTIVYPLGNGSILKNFELRMSLRSIEKNLSGFTDVAIVGDFPAWGHNLYHIQAMDPYKIGDQNIMYKLSLACKDEKVSDPFLYFNDDHYLLTQFDAPTFPNLYHSTLEKYFKLRGPDVYGKRAESTLKHLQEKNLPTKFFDIHTPILIHKQAFIQNVVNAPWDRTSFLAKSLYANSLSLEGIEELDCKLAQPPQVKAKVFSSFPHMKASVTRFLVEQFPKMSNFEKYSI
jgi:hypothetical protein